MVIYKYVFPLALKIQCSSSAFYLLEEIGGYTLHCRGMMQVKVRITPSHSNYVKVAL